MSRGDELAIDVDIGGGPRDRVQIGEVERVAIPASRGMPGPARIGSEDCVQDALNRLIMVASSADGMDGLAILEVEHGNDLEGHFRHGSTQRCRTILVHEWVTGGGLAGSAVARVVGGRGPCHAAGDRRRLRPLAGGTGTGHRDPGRTPARRPGPLDHRADRARASTPIACASSARAADFTVLIAPETRGILAGLTRDLEQAGARFLGSTAEAVELAGDKARLAARLQAARDRHAADRTIVPAQGLPRRRAISRRFSSRSTGPARSIRSTWPIARSLPAAARAMPVALLQPFVPGTPMSASFLVGQGGRAWLIGVGIQHDGDPRRPVRVSGGHDARHRAATRVPQLQPAVEAIAGLRGFVGVDFIWDAARRHATILEINPRPTTSCVGLVPAAAAGPPGPGLAGGLRADRLGSGAS